MNDHPVSTWIMNVIGTGTIVATFIGYMPGVAAGAAALWYFIQVWESATVRRWRANRRIRKLARLKARVVMLEASDRASILPSSGLRDDGLDVISH